MSSTSMETRPAARLWRRPPPAGGTRPAWLPVWSKPAAYRALRATIIVPGLFAITYKVVGDLQMATFAAFGGFATLVMAAFGGRKRDQAVAHLALAVCGSVLLIIGTAVNGSTWVAAIVTVPVAFVVLVAGVAGPNGAGGVNAALLAYVLPAASPGNMSMVPARLEGWWLASAAGTAAVLLLSPRPPGQRLRVSAAKLSRALSDQLEAALRGENRDSYREASIAAKHDLLAAFTATPFRPTGLATADQALDSLVGLLEWTTAVVCDSLREYTDLSAAEPVERELLAATSVTLRDIGAVLDGEPTVPDLPRLEQGLAESVAHLRQMRDSDGYAEAVHLSYHARTAGVAAHTAATDALITARRADAALVADGRRRWFGIPDPVEEEARAERRLAGLAGASSIVTRNASLRSVWFLNAVRGAVALAAAIAIADVTGVQHGFWVVLGTLSVLRTNAASTGSTAMRALIGTTAGFVVGALLILAIGTSQAALWTALPVAVIIAAYAPGTAPFAVGQAAFTVVVSVLYNLLVPAGWKIGVLRIEDVAIGCAVSIVVGVLFWPRGAAAVVADDLAEAFRQGSIYLTDSVDWALGLRHDTPAAEPAVTAGLRLDDALRGFLAEQGAKRVPKEDLWRLVGGTVRLRLTAHSLAGLPSPDVRPDPYRLALGEQARQIGIWYDHLASRIGHPDQRATAPFAPPALHIPALPTGDDGLPHSVSCAAWVGQHLEHIAPHLNELVGPATNVAAQRRAPWWR